MEPSMTISGKIYATCGILIVALTIQAGVALAGFTEIRSGVQTMTGTSVPGILYSGMMSTEIYHLRSLSTHHILSRNPAEMAAMEKSVQDILKRLHDDMHLFEGTIRTENDRQDFAKLTALVSESDQEWQAVLPLSRAGKMPEAAALYAQTTAKTVSEMNALLPRMAAKKLAAQAQTSATANSTANFSLWVLLAVCAAFTLAGLTISAFMVRGIRGRNRSAGTFRFKSDIRSMIEFQHLNLMETLPEGYRCAVIFCRNIMIYFDKPTQEDLVRRLSNHLEDGGYLFIGHSESLNGISHCFDYVSPAIYRKPGGTRDAQIGRRR
jgi:CHASE3 domain sensor protein